MKKFTALMLALVMCFSLFAGCSSEEETTTAAPAGDTTTAAPSGETTTAAPAEGPVEIVTATNTTFATLDPALMSTTAMSAVYAQTGANLFKTDVNGNYQNELCESYELSEDSLTYTFKLKEGIKWSDGEPLTAEHCVFGIKRSIGYGPMNAYAARNLTSFIVGAAEAAEQQMDVADMTEVGVNVIDDLTFEVKLVEPHPFFHKFFAGNVTAPMRPDFAVEHESAWSVDGTIYPCLGAMKLESISAEEQAVYVKNENYWNAENVTLDKITWLVMPDSTAQLNAFKAGELDVALNVPTEVSTNAEYANMLYKGEKYTSTYFVLLNGGPKNTVPAFKDANVRKAMTLAINKPVMIEILGGGSEFIVQLDGFIPYGFAGLNDDFRAEASYHTYNLEEAKKLMEAAGYNENNRLKFEYLYSNSQFHADVAQMLQQFWSAIYIDAELKSVEGGVFYDFVDNGDFSACRYANNDSSDPLNYFKIFTTDAQIDGCQSIRDDKYDQLVAEAYTITDQTKYIEKLHEIEDYMVGEQSFVIPLFTQIPVVLVSENVQGFWTGVAGGPDFTGVTFAN
ncbi:MAG: peptide ABC transporter substrate-binding protein [Clostridia bacterium]|nr:peptide ABC transporter substrate-binding protein [Clostridia bacterium]